MNVYDCMIVASGLAAKYMFMEKKKIYIKKYKISKK